MTELLWAQQEFARCESLLVAEIYRRGFACTLGDAFRDTRCTYGHPESVHKKRLAQDLNLFLGDKFLKDTVDHKQFGDFWKSLHPLARWGGDFEDGNHYSFEWDGVK